MDFIFGIFIFSICLVLYYKFIPNIQSQELDNLQDVYMETKSISEALVSQGYPSNWTDMTVERIGITDGTKMIDSAKMIWFHNLSSTNYSKTRKLFGIRGDYVVFFTHTNSSPASLGGIYHIGHPLVTLDANNRVDLSALDYDNLVSLERILLYDKKTINMVVYSWR